MIIFLFFSVFLTSSPPNRSSDYHTEPMDIDLTQDMHEVTNSTQLKVDKTRSGNRKTTRLIESASSSSKISSPDRSNVPICSTEIPSQNTTKRKRKSNRTPAAAKKEILQLTEEDFGYNRPMFSPFSPPNYSNDGLKCDSGRSQYREQTTMLDSPLNQMDTVPSQKVTVSNSETAAHSNVDAEIIHSPANIYPSPYDNQYMTPIPSPSGINYASCQTPSDFDEPFSASPSTYQPPSNAMSEDNDEFLSNLDDLSCSTPSTFDPSIFDVPCSPLSQDIGKVTPNSSIYSKDDTNQHKKSTKKSLKSPKRKTQTILKSPSRRSPYDYQESVSSDFHSTLHETSDLSKIAPYDDSSKLMPPPPTPEVMRAPHSSSTYCTASKLTSIYPNKTPHSNTIPRSMNEEAAQYYPGDSQYPSDQQASQSYPGGSQYPYDPRASQSYTGDNQYPHDQQTSQSYPGDNQYPHDQQTSQSYPGGNQYPHDPQTSQSYPGGSQCPPDPQATQYPPGDNQKSSDNRFLPSTEHYTWNTTMLSQVSCGVNQVTSSTSNQTLSDNPNATHSSFMAPLNTDIDLEGAYNPNQVARQQSTAVIAPEKQICNVSSSNLPETMDVHSRLNEPMSAECAATNLDTAITSSEQSENAPSSAKGFSSDDASQVIDQAYEDQLIKEFEDLMHQIDLNYETEATSYFGPNYKSYLDQKKNTGEADDEDNDDENDDEEEDGEEEEEEEDDDDDDI